MVVQSASSNTTPKTNNLLSQCFDVKAKVVDGQSNPFQEVDDYLNFQLNEIYYIYDSSGDIDVLLFWKNHQHLFPDLSSLAGIYLQYQHPILSVSDFSHHQKML